MPFQKETIYFNYVKKQHINDVSITVLLLPRYRKKIQTEYKSFPIPYMVNFNYEQDIDIENIKNNVIKIFFTDHYQEIESLYNFEFKK